MFLELEQGFGRAIHISPQPMRQAVEALEATERVKARGEATHNPERALGFGASVAH